ncbi:MAG: response regulator [Planctomycetota bacterium]
MLVLSRRQNDKVLFPNLGISVHILRVEGSKVRVGVEAPPEVKVLRHEVPEWSDSRGPRGSQPRNRQPGGLRGVTPRDDAQLRRRLHSAAESLNALYRLCDQNLPKDAEKLIYSIFKHLRAIDETTGGGDLLAGPSLKRIRRALLVEDNPNESKLLAGYLRMQKFDVDVASDGTAAIDYLGNHAAPDVVLLDMHMPGMDGATAIHRIRADERRPENHAQSHLKVYAVSGSDPADHGVDIGPLGVDGWFPKPLDPEALMFRLAFDGDADSQTLPPKPPRRSDSVAAS